MGQSLLDATLVSTYGGIRTPFGVMLPPGARVAAYVRSTGLQSGDDAFLATNLCTTLAQGLARARAGMGDYVVCLPGHVESVADGTTFSAALVAGTKILGVGKGTNQPTFTWNATAAQWAVAVADVQITGLRLLFDGITAVVAAIAVSAADFTFVGNDVEVSTTSKAPTAGITLAVGAARAVISGNNFRGDVAASVATALIVISGAAPGIAIEDNDFICPVTIATGHISVAAACLGLKICRNNMYNTTASSTACVSFGAFAADGIVADNRFAIGTTGAAAAGVLVGATATVRLFQNFCSGVARATGILTGTAAT